MALDVVRARGVNTRLPNSHEINMCLELTKFTKGGAEYLYDLLEDKFNDNKLKDDEAVAKVLDFVEKHRDQVRIVTEDSGEAWEGRKPIGSLAKLNLALMDEDNQIISDGVLVENLRVDFSFGRNGECLRAYGMEVEPQKAEEAAAVVSPGDAAAGASAATGGGGTHG